MPSSVPNTAELKPSFVTRKLCQTLQNDSAANSSEMKWQIERWPHESLLVV